MQLEEKVEGRVEMDGREGKTWWNWWVGGRAEGAWVWGGVFTLGFGATRGRNRNIYFASDLCIGWTEGERRSESSLAEGSWPQWRTS